MRCCACGSTARRSATRSRGDARRPPRRCRPGRSRRHPRDGDLGGGRGVLRGSRHRHLRRGDRRPRRPGRLRRPRQVAHAPSQHEPADRRRRGRRDRDGRRLRARARRRPRLRERPRSLRTARDHPRTHPRMGGHAAASTSPRPHPSQGGDPPRARVLGRGDGAGGPAQRTHLARAPARPRRGGRRRSRTARPLALAAAKRAIGASYEDAGRSAGTDEETRSLLALFASNDGREGVRAFVEKRAARFEGR